jgi:hypothetical protein
VFDKYGFNLDLTILHQFKRKENYSRIVKDNKKLLTNVYTFKKWIEILENMGFGKAVVPILRYLLIFLGNDCY